MVMTRDSKYQKILKRAQTVFGSVEKAERWLNTPNKELDDKSPKEILHEDDGYGRIEDLLGRREHGNIR